MAALHAVKVKSIGAGSCTSFAVTEEGEMWGWGKNNVGQMGQRATKTPKLVPEVVMRNQEMSRIRQVRTLFCYWMYLVIPECLLCHSWKLLDTSRVGIYPISCL